MASLAAASTTAAPSAATPSVDMSNEPESGGGGKKVKAPSMVIDEDVNGFRAQHKVGEGKRRKKVSERSPIDDIEAYVPYLPEKECERKPPGMGPF
jgi:splicing factor 45